MVVGWRRWLKVLHRIVSRLRVRVWVVLRPITPLGTSSPHDPAVISEWRLSGADAALGMGIAE